MFQSNRIVPFNHYSFFHQSVNLNVLMEQLKFSLIRNIKKDISDKFQLNSAVECKNTYGKKRIIYESLIDFFRY